MYLKNWAGYGNFRRSRYNKILLSQNLSEFLKYGPYFWHDIITFIDFIRRSFIHFWVVSNWPPTTHPPPTQTQYLLMSHLLLTWFGPTFKGKFLAPLSQLSGHICPVILPNNFWTKSFVVLEFFWLKMLFDHIYHSMWKVGQSIIVCQLASHQPLKPPETKHG